MSKLFISHSSKDKDFVRKLCLALHEHGQDAWVDTRELRGGDPLWEDIQAGIEAAPGFAVLVSPNGLQSKWLGKELRHALKIRHERGADKYPVIPLSLNDTQLGVLEEYFDAEPLYIPVSSAAGGVDAAINAILIAMGKRLGAELAATPQPKPEALEELVLELTDFKFTEQDGKRRASARARLVYEPANADQAKVYSEKPWRLLAPIGPIEAQELRWYLEQYASWPSQVFNSRAKAVEDNLQCWGKLLYQAAMPVAQRENVLRSWATISDLAKRRFSVYVDTAQEAGTPEADVLAAKEAATVMLGLPWELLHDGTRYLFQGAKPSRVRRRLPNTELFAVPVVATPIRILLVTARPEDDACVYIDHRISALPLVAAMEALPGQVSLHLLSPPTLPALCAELERAREQNQPYHVLHFNGHGTYNSHIGLGGLCFETPEDENQLTRRRHITIYTNELGSMLHHYRIPLVFLEACQSAQAESGAESVASELLKVGVCSVVAMSHSVLVETARRFVASFYSKLAQGSRVGDAMLAGQRALQEDTVRGEVFGEGKFCLQDWFVPVLFQEKNDPQLFTHLPNEQTVADFRAGLQERLGALPPEPETGFIGRSRELLALERLLHQPAAPHYGVVLGQGGEGKTTLACEFARWAVRSQQVQRAAFVSVEMHSHASAVLDALGRQLVEKNYSVATFANMEQALLPIERALREQATLLVLDNMESILPPPYLAQSDGLPEVLQEEAQHELNAILALCARLNAFGATWLIFTSREALPAPFNAERKQLSLHQLQPDDAVKLVKQTLHAEATGALTNAAQEEIEQLVVAVHGHARTLALLAPSLRKHGVTQTHRRLVALMLEMEQKFPNSREKSLFASVELSLRRMSAVNRERVRVLGLFHGGVQLNMLRFMMAWDEADVASLAQELLQTGLATPNRFNHLTLNPALCPYLLGGMAEQERATLTASWVRAMGQYVKFLCQEQHKNAELAHTLTLLELANLFALLKQVQNAGDAEATINLTTMLYSLLQFLGKPRLLTCVGQVRDVAATAMGAAWNHAQFQAARTRIDQQFDSGQMQAALEGAQALYQRAQAAGEQAYPNADLDLAMARYVLAVVLNDSGDAEPALVLLAEAGQRFAAIANARSDQEAEQMAAVCITAQGDCLSDLGRLAEAAAAYEEAIRRAEQLGNERCVAVGKGQLGTVRLNQKRYPEALAAYADARERFSALGESGTVATAWHQTGIVHQAAGQAQAAENAYRKALSIQERLGNVAGQAGTLSQLGILYGNLLGRTEEAVTFFRLALEKTIASHNVGQEGRTRKNLAMNLHQLNRLDEARQEICRAIECDTQFGQAAEPWKSWFILSDIETAANKPSAAEQAKAKAIASYLAYRRAGGENHYNSGRLSLPITQALLAGDPASASALLQQLAADPEAAHLHSFIAALQVIVNGSRERSLADAPDLDYTMAAEIQLLLDTLTHPPPS